MSMRDLDTLRQAVIVGNKPEAEEKIRAIIDADILPETILKIGLIAAMDEVGQLFENGQLFLPEMLVASRAMQGALAILKPHLVEQGVTTSGKILIGTVEGDLHDIGKNLVAMMIEGAGFDVVDLGTDVSPEAFCEAIREHNPDVVGLSALLTTTMHSMKSTIKSIEENELRDNVRIIIGGAPVTEEFAQEIGADGCASDASRAVTLTKSLL